MKHTLIYAFLLVANLCFAQTKELVKIPGTKCSLIPPSGFKASSSISGFLNEEHQAYIMISEIPESYEKLIIGFTAEALKSRGMNLIEKQIIDKQNKKGTLFYMSQTANGTSYLKQMLIFGDDKQTILVNGIYPVNSKSIEAQIKESILTTIYSADQDDNPLDAVPFAINVENTEFKVSKYMVGSLLYSIDGKIPTEKPTLVVGSSLGKIPVKDPKLLAQERIKQIPGASQASIKEINEINIDNMKGYEIIADGKSPKGLPELTYQVMLFEEGGGYYIIVGQSTEEMNKYIGIYRNIAKTFKRIN